MNKKKIVAVTGCRSEYDIIYSVLKALKQDPRFEVSVIATGAHLSENFGYTINEVIKDRFDVVGKIHSLVNSDQPIGKAKSSGILLSGLSDKLDNLRPDFVLVAGDREEALISAIAANYLKIPLIHVAGGDRAYPGDNISDVDEPVRHATSKLASLHFTMTQEHSQRLIKMGEEPWRVICSGNPALDRFKELDKISKSKILRYFGFESSSKPLILMIQHVMSGEYVDGCRQTQITLDALSGLDVNCIVNYPNSDFGSQEIIELLESKKIRAYPNIRISKNSPRDIFVNLLRNIDVLIGNSSMAFCEGSYLRLPAINVGNRQRERLHGGNVTFVEHDIIAIKQAVEKILNEKKYHNRIKRYKQVYGNGNAAKKIVRTLASLKKTKDELLAKDITY